MAESPPVELAKKAIDKLELPLAAKQALFAIQSELTAAYQQRFVEMVQAISRQASALERLQTTLNILVEHLAPQLKSSLPVALRVSSADEQPDVASVMVTADPIGAGFVMTQADLAEGLGLSTPDVSILARAFKLTEEEDCAAVLRRGTKHTVVNYHPRAIARFRELVANPPAGLNTTQKKTLERVVKKLLVSTPSPSR